MADLPAGSVVINANGMGKNRPGSPVTDAARIPERGIVWEPDHRGERDFLRRARGQQAARSLVIEDGWTYFLHGWTQVIAEVFDIDLTEEQLAALDAAASDPRPS